MTDDLISAKIIKHSKSAYTGQEIITYSLEYPRMVHSELMAHRLFSRNAASSRAIPINKMMEMVKDTPAMPVEWGINQAGMQAKELHESPASCEWAWRQAAKSAVESAELLQSMNLHKQIVNRVLEPFQVMKTIVTATEFDNFFWLRCHTDAQPEIRAFAEKMYEVYLASTPQELEEGEWHLPYVDVAKCSIEGTKYLSNNKEVTLEDAKKISASCCAQVSYRLLDDSIEKALKIYNQLVTMVPVHASPVEHQATPIPEYNEECLTLFTETGNIGDGFEGVTHLDEYGSLWSGNLRNWVQQRQLIKGHTKYGDERDGTVFNEINNS